MLLIDYVVSDVKMRDWKCCKCLLDWNLLTTNSFVSLVFIDVPLISDRDNRNSMCSILFCSILFCSVLFYSILFYSILFYSILFYHYCFIYGDRD